VDAHSHADALFFGRITASMTHEVKNVLATINETGGLLEDLLEINREVDFPHRERFEAGVASILETIQRGLALMNRFNRFAHSPDRDRDTIDCAVWIDQIVYLCQRFARLKMISLEVSPPADGADAVELETDPFAFQMALFAGLDLFLQILGPEDRLIVGWTPAAGGVSITLTATSPRFGSGDPAASREDDALAALRPLVAAIGGTLERSGDARGLIIHLPRHMPQRA
jgi:hypothetical protein